MSPHRPPRLTRHEWKTSGAVKLRRAYELADSLDAEIEAFLKLNDSFRYHEHYNAPVDVYWTLEPLSADLLRWAAIASDVMHNLHVALEFLWKNATRGTHANGSRFRAHESPIAFRDYYHRNPKHRSALPPGMFDALKTVHGDEFRALRVNLICLADNHSKHVDVIQPSIAVIADWTTRFTPITFVASDGSESGFPIPVRQTKLVQQITPNRQFL